MCLGAFSIPRIFDYFCFPNCCIALYFIDGPYFIYPFFIAQHFGCYYFFTINICCKAKPYICIFMNRCVYFSMTEKRTGSFCTDMI